MNKEFFKQVFKEKRLKLSHPRFLIYQELSGAQIPLSPQELYRELLKKRRRIGLTSIYRSLDLFESLGIAFKVVNGPNIRYKLCGLRNHHHHIICKRCGHIVEFAFCDIASWVKKLGESTGYQVTDHQFNFTGLCRNCKKNP